MSDPTRPASIVTPEAIALDLDIAGAGSRLIAFLLDFLVLMGFSLLMLMAGLALSLAGVSREALFVTGGSLGTVAFLGYFPLLEGLRGGQTIGKSSQKLRVIQADGRPLAWQPCLVRNIMRLVDVTGFVGLFFIVATKRSQRLGDLAAGTIVVHEHAAPMPNTVELAQSYDRDRAAATLDTSLLAEREYAMIRSFLERRSTLTPKARQQLADQISEVVGLKLRITEYGMPAETFLEAVLVSVRQRHETPGSGPVQI